LAPLPEPPSESTLPGEPIRDAAPARDLDLEPLRKRGLMVPVLGVSPWQIRDSYDAARDGGRRHDAQDILAPRGTPVLVADDGVILRIGTNALGGNVIWAADSERRFAYYYAHLDHYARDVREGMRVKRGDVIGFVGTTGNSPVDTPHLHFQAMRILDEKRYVNSPPFNPLPFFTMPGVTR
jgi:murein DD-endopeptidase MepM/ murein hydrolase activator NlpD